MGYSREGDERGFLHVLLEIAATGHPDDGDRGHRLLSDASRLLEADVLYTVVEEHGEWTKAGYDENGSLGSVAMGRPSGVVRHVLSKRTRILQPHLSNRGTFQRHHDGWPGRETASYLAVPIHRQGRIRGVLVLLRGPDRAPFGLDDIARAELLAEALAVRSDLGDRIAGLEKLSWTDGLTQLPNYRWARELLAREMVRARQLGEPLSIVMIEVDGLKECNRRHGFLAGSDLLVRIAQTIGRAVRGSDHVARFGGDEFLLVLPATDAAGATCVGERICATVHRELAKDQRLSTVSLAHAVACYPDDGSDYAELITTVTRSLSPTDTAGADRSGSTPEETDRRAA